MIHLAIELQKDFEENDVFKKWFTASFCLAVCAVACWAYVAAHGQEREGPGGGGLGGGPGRFGGPMTFPLLRALDADSDGELSAKEIENATAALKTLDADKDGKLNRTELMGEFGRPGGRGPGGGFGGPDASEVVARYMAFDKNGDGKLSKDELPARMQGLLEMRRREQRRLCRQSGTDQTGRAVR